MRISLATVFALACVTTRAADYDCIIEARQNVEIDRPADCCRHLRSLCA